LRVDGNKHELINQFTIEAYKFAIRRLKETKGNLIEVYRRLQRHLIWIAIGHVVLGKKSIGGRFQKAYIDTLLAKYNMTDCNPNKVSFKTSVNLDEIAARFPRTSHLQIARVYALAASRPPHGPCRITDNYTAQLQTEGSRWDLASM
jgi:hypothetical protein